MRILNKMRFISLLLMLLLVVMMAAPKMVMAAALGSDATLKASSTVKGETLLSLGSSSASGDIWSNGGTVTITAAEAANTTNLTPYITLFDPTYAGATVKVVKYAQWSNVGNFDSAPAYANQAITNQDYFWVKVTAPDTTTLYYKVVVTVTPIANVSAITVTGNTVVGATLTAAPTPSGATGTYQWKSSGSADGTYANITGATSSTYVIGKAYKRKFIKVTFTATGSYSGTQTSVATTAVSKKGKILK